MQFRCPHSVGRAAVRRACQHAAGRNDQYLHVLEGGIAILRIVQLRIAAVNPSMALSWATKSPCRGIDPGPDHKSDQAVVNRIPRLRTQLTSTNEDGGESDGCMEVSSELVISGCDTPPILEATEGAFDDIAGFVALFVEGRDILTPGVWRDHRLCAAIGQEGAKIVAVKSGVRQQEGCRGEALKQRLGGTHIAPLARCEIKGDQAPERVGDGMDFGAATAAAAPDCFGLGPPFPPALQRCALLVVLSIDCISD